jgi:PKD repeat protein
MNRIGGMATRTTVFVAVFLAFLMLGLPSMNLGGNNVGSGAVGNAEAVIADRFYTVGWIGFTGDFATMNPFLYTMAAEYAVIWQCAGFLLMYNMENEYIGDLAENFTTLPDGVTFHFDLVRNAWWIDPLDPTAQTELVTWEDVAWTYWEINNNTKNHLHSYLPEIIESISMRDGDPFKLEIVLKSPYAPFYSAMTSIPIMPEHIWSLEDPLKFSNLPMVSCGSFYYPSTVLPKSEARLYSNTLYYQQENRGWQMHNGQLVFRNEGDAGTGMLELENGIIDTLVGVPPAVYVNEVLPGLIPNVYGQAQSTGFVYEFNLNQLTPELRDELGWRGSNNPLLLRPEIKLAFQMIFDKQTFVDDVLMGLGTIGDSLVPDVNPWHYTYGLQESEDPILGRAPDGEEPVAFNPTAARQMLMDHGWAYDSLGNPAVAATCPLYQKGTSNSTVYWPLSFNCYSLLPEQEWAEGTNLIAGDARDAGILLHGEASESDPPTLLQSSQMNTLWYSGDYDTWLWDWFFSPLSEVCTDVMSVLTTAEIDSWSDVYWSNATYDDIYTRALYSTDPVARMNLTDQLQRMAYEESGCNAVAYRKELYGLSTEKWTNYGNWEKYFMLMPDWSMPYLYSMFSPVDNHAPTVQVQQSFTGDIGVAKSIPITANDDMSTSLEYRWFWGDGTKSNWMTSNTNSHVYAEDGVYTCYVAARETNVPAGSTDDFFISWNQTELTISDPTNDAPGSLSISIDPTDPDTGTSVSITGSAVDPEGDDLYYSWTFGDTYTGMGQTVSHQWTSTGIFTLSMSVTDNHIGTGTRPQKTSILVSVAANGPPSISVPDMAGIEWKTPVLYTVTGSDPNPRDTLRYTWDWGDGSIDVTSVPQAYHTYTQQATYSQEVFLDDLTGLPGHNVSDIGLIEVVNVGNVPPEIVSFGADDTTPYTYQLVTFTGVARDADGDGLTWTFMFGDGELAVDTTGTTLPSTDVQVQVQHAYAAAGPYTAYLYVFDGAANRTSSGVGITVAPNDPPVLDPLTQMWGDTGDLVSFSASAFDPDDDPMTVWWDFDDGSPLEGGLDMFSVTHTYAASGDYQYGVFVADGAGHNVTDRAWVHQSLPPTIDPLADQDFSTGVAKDVTASATDPDGDPLRYTWDFGDSTPLVVGNPASHTYASAGVYTITVWADDLFPVTGHNVSTTATATVTDVLLPPVADAGADQNVMALEVVTFDGSASYDSDGTIMAWYWTFNYDGTDYNLSGETQEFTFTTEPVTVVVTLFVVDNDGLVGSDTMTVNVAGMIPEFTVILLPVAGLVILLVGLSRWKKKQLAE